MAKFCKKCGVKHANRAFQCSACGTPFPSGRDYPDLMKYTRHIFLGAILVFAVVILTIYFTSPETAARRIVKAYKMNDAGSVVASCPQFLLESDRFDAEAFAKDAIYDANKISRYSFGYRVDNTSDPSTKELERLMEEIRYYGGDGFDDSDIKDVKIIWIGHDMEYTDVWEASRVRFVMIKYDGSWYWWPDGIE